MKSVSILLFIGILSMAGIQTKIHDVSVPSTDVRILIGDHAQQTKEVFDKFVRVVLNQKETDAVKELFHQDFSMYHCRDTVPAIQGRDHFKQAVDALVDSCFSYQLDMNQIEFMAYNDRIAIFWEGGELLNNLVPKINPPVNTHNKVIPYGVAVYRFKEGKIAECRFWRYNQYQFSHVIYGYDNIS